MYAFLTTERLDYLLNYYYYHAALVMQRLGNDKGAKIYKKRSVKFIMSKLDGGYAKVLENEGFKELC